MKMRFDGTRLEKKSGAALVAADISRLPSKTEGHKRYPNNFCGSSAFLRENLVSPR